MVVGIGTGVDPWGTESPHPLINQFSNSLLPPDDEDVKRDDQMTMK